jgi:hypothetical protein
MPIKQSVIGAALAAACAANLMCLPADAQALAQALYLGNAFITGTYASTKSSSDCATDAMAALRENGFTVDLRLVDFYRPTMAASGSTAQSETTTSMTGLVFCTEHHDLVFTVSTAAPVDTKTRLDQTLNALIQTFRRLGTRK